MLDSLPAPLQRSRGEARVSLKASARGTVIEGLRQAGSAKAFLPRTDAGVPELVFLNTSGGLTGGDTLSYAITLRQNARAAAATQTAERGYRAIGGAAAEVRVDIDLAEGAHLDWLPQETILFDGAAMNRVTTVNLAPTATYLGVEMLVLGRAAMGERLGGVHLNDRRQILRAGRPLVIDPVAVDGASLDEASTAGLNGNRALASLVLVTADAEDRLEGVRARLCPGAAASAWDGRLVVRALSHDAAPVRRMMAGLIEYLTARPLPRVWQV